MQSNDTPNPTKAFLKGLRELRVMDVESCKADIMAALEINNPVSFRNYSRGLNGLDVDKFARIQAVFAKYGVKDPWGI